MNKGVLFGIITLLSTTAYAAQGAKSCTPGASAGVITAPALEIDTAHEEQNQLAAGSNICVQEITTPDGITKVREPGEQNDYAISSSQIVEHIKTRDGEDHDEEELTRPDVENASRTPDEINASRSSGEDDHSCDMGVTIADLEQVPVKPDANDPQNGNNRPNVPEPGDGNVVGPIISPINPDIVNPGHVDQLQQGQNVSQVAMGEDLYAAAVSHYKNTVVQAEDDHRLLKTQYQNLDRPRLYERYDRAGQELRRAASDLNIADGGIYPGEALRMSNTYADAADLADLAKLNLGKSLQNRILASQPPELPGFDSTLFDLGIQNFGVDHLIPFANDGLIDKLIMLNGLEGEQRAEVFKQLNLAERQVLKLPDGKTSTIYFVTHGQFMWKPKKPVDCSVLLSKALPIEVRKGTFTAWDYRSMWVYRKTGHLPRKPTYKKDRAVQVKETATAFDSLNLYSTDQLMAGDLLIHYLPWRPENEAFLVKEYNARTMQASVIHIDQSTQNVKSKTFSLTLDKGPVSRRSIASQLGKMVRPGIYGLRVRPQENKVCSLKYGSSKPPLKSGRKPVYPQNPKNSGVAQ